MGCGATLTLSPDGAVTCSNTECPDPRAVKTILANPHTDHLVVLTPNEVNVQHPLKERADGSLLACAIGRAIFEAGRSALEDGTYSVRVTDPEAHPNDWSWERLA
jgi:hypothetical protein